MKNIIFGLAVLIIGTIYAFDTTTRQEAVEHQKAVIEWEAQNSQYFHDGYYVIPRDNNALYMITECYECPRFWFDLTSDHKENPYPQLAPYMVDK